MGAGATCPDTATPTPPEAWRAPSPVDWERPMLGRNRFPSNQVWAASARLSEGRRSSWQQSTSAMGLFASRPRLSQHPAACCRSHSSSRVAEDQAFTFAVISVKPVTSSGGGGNPPGAMTAPPG
eukprot:9489604-Pyramimonas_sp.AAC.1